MAPSADRSRAPASSPIAAFLTALSTLYLAPGPRRRALLVAVAVVAAICMMLLSIGPITGSVARSRAEEMGIALTIRSTHVGFFMVRLSGVGVSSKELPGVTAELADVEVFPKLTGVRRVAVHGGQVSLHGTRDELGDELARFRKAHGGRGGARSGSARAMPLTAEGIDISWTAEAGDPEQHVWGARFERDEDGTERAGADLASVSTGASRLEVSHGSAELRRDGDRRVLTSLSAEHVTAAVDLGDTTARTAASPAGRKPSPSAAEPREGALRLREELGRAAESAARFVKESTTLELDDVRFEVRHEGQKIDVGPAKVVFEHAPGVVKVSVTSGEGERAPPIRFDIAVPLGEGAVDVGLAGGPVSLAALGVKEHDMGLEAVDRADVEVNGRASLAADGSSVHLRGSAKLSELSLFQPRLSAELVRGLRLGVSGDTDVSLDGSDIHFKDVDVDFGKVKLLASGALERAEGHARGNLHLEIPLAACSDMLGSIPDGLAPLLGGLEMSGTFAFAGDLSFDSRRPRDTRVTWEMGNGCKITRVPPILSTDRFTRPWVRTVIDAGGRPLTVESGPGTATWVPYFDVTPYMTTAVVVCEDANFFYHGGFNQKSLQDSIRDDLTAGKFVRGGSTVTMQLAKNLYLRREKTLSRKLQEAVLTLLLEQSLTKEQILEIYLNVIEFAPGLYGIGPAAAYYFHSTPRELSLAQALYLISILPNPKVNHFKPDGSLSDRWTEYLRHLMQIAHKIRRVDDRELATGLEEVVHRGVAAGQGEANEHDDSDVPPTDPDPDGP